MKGPPSKMQMVPQRAVAAVTPPNLVVAPVKLYMLSCPSVSHKRSIFFERHHALYTHTPNFLSTAISRFPIFLVEILPFLVQFSLLFPI